jgi:hypothetical protein
MKRVVWTFTFLCACLALSRAAWPQSAEAPAASAPTPVPALVPLAGVAADAHGKPLDGEVTITFRIYSDEQSGDVLWSETQTVALDSAGHYKAELGALSPDGIPIAIFETGEARWLEAQVAGQPAQPRVLLASVPYAMKAANAELLSGHSAGEFVTREQLSEQLAGTSRALSATGGDHPDTSPSGSGTANTVPLWASSSKLGDSAITQLGTAAAPRVGVGTSTPASTLDVNGATTLRGSVSLPAATGATATAGTVSPTLSMTGSSFKSGGAAVAQRFGWRVEPQSNNTVNPSSTLTLLYSAGGEGLANTGLALNPNGQISFAAGQTFPGTLASVSASAPLTVTTSGGAVSMGLNTSSLQGTLNGAYAQLGAANTFKQNQAMNQGLTVAGTASANLVNSATGYQLGGVLFASGNSGTQNVSLGFSSSPSEAGGFNVGIGPGSLGAIAGGESNIAVGAGAMPANVGGSNNTAIGSATLSANLNGNDNVALGVAALLSHPSGSNNTAIGNDALKFWPAGNSNTAVGNLAGYTINGQPGGTQNTFIGYWTKSEGTAALTDATAIGANAIVGESNALILGGTGGDAVDVGIGTATPFNDYALDVEATTNSQIDSGVVVNAGGGNLYLGMTNGKHKFRVDTDGVAYADGGYQSSGADFAESVAVRGSRSKYEPGDLLAIDPGGQRRLALARTPYSTLVAGIYSTKPGMLASPHGIDDSRPSTTEVPLAVVGIVPCKVTAENGPIHVGDMLVTSSRPGYAMKGTRRSRMLGAVVGKALEPLPRGTGLIQVLVTLQ